MRQLAAVFRQDAHPLDRPSVLLVDQDDVGRPGSPILAPLPQREHDRMQGLALIGQRIDHFALVGGVRRAMEDAARDELAQTIGQDVAGNSKARLELFKMMQAVDRAAQNQEGPFLADQFNGGGKRASDLMLLSSGSGGGIILRADAL